MVERTYLHTMKKRVFSFILIFVLLFSAGGTAQAETYIDLGSVSAGTEARIYIADLPASGSVESTGLPSGCFLDTADGKIFLCGAPYFAGPYEFELSSPDEFHAVCSVRILPATPSVESCKDVSCSVGDQAQLYVDTYIGDSGTVSYQWYTNSSRSTSGGTAVSGATGCWFTPNTGSTGVFYYYCQVTNNNCGYTASAFSSPITVTVGHPGPSSISVSSMPRKTDYTVGDMLDPSGLTIRVAYPGREETISADYQLDPMQLTREGIQSVTVTYEGMTCSFPVSVKPKQERKLEIVSRPAKLSYKVGDWLDTKGMKLRLTDGNKITEISSGFTCTPTTLTSAGNQVITVKYNDLSCTFNVQVEEGRREISISVKSLPTRTSYTLGESLDSSGLVLTLTTSEGTENISSGFTFNPTVFNTKGRQLVQVRYHDLTCTFVVNISDAPAAPTATPTPSAAPSAEPAQPSSAPAADPTAAPTAAPRPTHVQTEKKSSSGAVIVLIVSISALVGLCSYVLLMNNGGIEGLIENIKRYLRR